MTSQPNYLDLDTIDTEVTLVVKLDGKEHKLQAITVEDFVSNLQLVQKMGTTGSVEQEMDMLIEMLNKAFPSIGKPRLYKLSLLQLNAMNAKAREFNGEQQISDETREALEADGATNPQTPTS